MTHLPHQNILSVFELCVFIKLHVLHDVAHVVNDAIYYREQSEDHNADHVFLHVEYFVGASGRQANERKNH